MFMGNSIIASCVAGWTFCSTALLAVSCEKPGAEVPLYSPEDVELNTLVKNYTEASYTSRITEVTVTGDKVSVSGSYAGDGEFFVAEIPPSTDLLRMEDPLSVHRPESDTFTFETDRFTGAGDLEEQAAFQEGWFLVQDAAAPIRYTLISRSI